MSFGKSHPPLEQAVYEAVKYPTSKGVLLVHSAGTEGVDLAREARFPTANYLDGGQSDSWLEVGASGWNGVSRHAAQLTNYGVQQVDLLAPGVAIHTTWSGLHFSDRQARASRSGSASCPARARWSTPTRRSSWPGGVRRGLAGKRFIFAARIPSRGFHARRPGPRRHRLFAGAGTRSGRFQ